MGLALVGLLLAALVAGSLWLRSGAGRSFVVERLRPRLEARLGPVMLGDTWGLVGGGGVVLGPLEVRGPADDGEGPLLTIARVIVRPDWSALLRGRLQLAALDVEDVHLELGRRAHRLGWLEERLRGARARPGANPASAEEETRALPAVVLERATLGLGPDARLGPARVSLSLAGEGSGRLLTVDVAWDGGLGHATVGRDQAGDGHVEAHWNDLPLEPLARALRPGLIDGGRTWGTLTLEARELRYELTVAEAQLTWAPLSPAAVGPWTVAARGSARLSDAGDELVLPEVKVALGAARAVELELNGRLPRTGTGPFELGVSLPPTSLQALLAALPPALSPRAEVGHIDGPLSAHVTLEGLLEDRGAWQVQAGIDVEELRRVARSAPGSPLLGPFLHRPLVGAEERGRVLQVGPDNPFFVPLGEVPRVLVSAVLLSEDSFFFAHPGFDVPSLVRNLLAPKDDDVVRGGSTLSQQLAKNLYLSREKTYARKVREALLTIALEASLPKERLLEVYLNVIEWGPDVYGLGEAAWHYFGKDARTLTSRESAFLATIIPNPIRYHGYCSRGALSEVWEQRVADLLRKLENAGELEPAEAMLARHERLFFAHRSRDDAFFAPPVQGDDDGWETSAP